MSPMGPMSPIGTVVPIVLVVAVIIPIVIIPIVIILIIPIVLIVNRIAAISIPIVILVILAILVISVSPIIIIIIAVVIVHQSDGGAWACDRACDGGAARYGYGRGGSVEPPALPCVRAAVGHGHRRGGSACCAEAVAVAGCGTGGAVWAGRLGRGVRPPCGVTPDGQGGRGLILEVLCHKNTHKVGHGGTRWDTVGHGGWTDGGWVD